MTPAPLQPGTLYLVATPIGNLEDITLRAIRTLRECSAIAAEDTRRTAQLLKALEIDRPLISCHKFNEARRTSQLLKNLENGEILALVSDAGTPGISDPGERIVRAALASGYLVESVPGPCALTAALPLSGLPTTEFHFVGFLPHKSGARIRKLETLNAVSGTLCFYESPHRIIKLLNEIASIWPESKVVLARELTKKFEEHLYGKPAELLEQYSERKPKGEYVVIIHRPA
ncbi:MAG: 16S rRNA (cytidine(1402)-2'-O)-methyltransferase [Verrucomicrobiota bacterium]|jgi:16S rRNA (cytidine1402-2'-O)-methyltransferase|nr:16S rRNA (cytidine(1402)-2'-O)-methyltransferase [Verrucomicrobiota bacterium]